MGSCLSKKSTSVSSPKPPEEQIEKSNTQLEKNKAQGEDEAMKKQVFVTKHGKSHEVERRSVDEKFEAQKPIDVVETGKNNNQIKGELGVVTIATPVRTSSCSKEEVDAILIQCGRLSRSSSAGQVGLSVSGGENHQRVRKYSGSKRSFDFDCENGTTEGQIDKDGVMKERESKRESRTGGSQEGRRRRRTPSREREQHRSGSKERGGGGGGRRVSRSPGRRSESPISKTSSATNSNNVSCRPGKMVSVPATVSSLAVDKSNNAVLGSSATGGGSGGGGLEPNSSSATTTVKRVQVKRAAGGVGGGGDSRGGASPRARSPARANQNQPPKSSLSRSNSRKAEQSPYRRTPLSEIDTNIVVEPKSVNNIAASQVPREKANAVTEESKGNKTTHTRSRSCRQSQDLDKKAESETPSYTALLLEDIQNFHQKNPTFTLPPSVTKACSILEAVADLNSSNSSNLFGEDKARNSIKRDDPIVESEVVANDDLMQPSFHKYVTLRRKGTNDDLEEEESSGSNSFVGLSSSWEPNSVDSTDHSACSVSHSSRQLVNKRHAASHSGIGRGRVGS